MQDLYYKLKKSVLFEQLYNDDRIYWHASDEDFSRLENKNTGIYSTQPVFIARNPRFFYEEGNRFTINPKDPNSGNKFYYCIEFTNQINLFNPKNKNDVTRAQPYIMKFINRLSEPDKQKQLLKSWEAYISTSYWAFVENEVEYGMIMQNRLLYKVLNEELKYLGFVASCHVSNGQIGVFDAKYLTILKKLSKEEFIEQYGILSSNEDIITTEKTREITKNILESDDHFDNRNFMINFNRFFGR